MEFSIEEHAGWSPQNEGYGEGGVKDAFYLKCIHAAHKR
jgi:hypothetical protein